MGCSRRVLASYTEGELPCVRLGRQQAGALLRALIWLLGGCAARLPGGQLRAAGRFHSVTRENNDSTFQVVGLQCVNPWKALSAWYLGRHP